MLLINAQTGQFTDNKNRIEKNCNKVIWGGRSQTNSKTKQVLRRVDFLVTDNIHHHRFVIPIPVKNGRQEIVDNLDDNEATIRL